VGALASTATLGLFIFGLINGGENGWTATSTVIPLVLFIVALAVLVANQRSSADPLLSPRVLSVRALRTSSLGLLLVSALMISIFYMASIYQQKVLGFTPLQAGLGVVGMGAPTLLMTLIIPNLMRRLGPPRVYTLGACLLLVGSLLLVALPNGDRSYFASMLPGLAIVGAGLPCCFAPLNAMGVMAVAPKDSGIASGILTAFNQTGAALGIASVVTLAQSHALNLIGQHHTVHSALTAGFRWGYLALAGIALVKVVLSVIIGNDFKKAMAARRAAA
jgi:Na+/melibiose symporter-like transporter